LKKKPVRSNKQQIFQIAEPYKNHFHNLKIAVKGFNNLIIYRNRTGIFVEMIRGIKF